MTDATLQKMIARTMVTVKVLEKKLNYLLENNQTLIRPSDEDVERMTDDALKELHDEFS